jgi:hypothetical protein
VMYVYVCVCVCVCMHGVYEWVARGYTDICMNSGSVCVCVLGCVCVCALRVWMCSSWVYGYMDECR